MVGFNREGLSSVLLETFRKEGYFILRDGISRLECERAKDFVLESLDPLIGPAELEVDVGYSGAPGDEAAEGGKTPRRLLHAYSRSVIMRELALNERVKSVVSELMETQDVMLSQCHHNCVMTKFPDHSSSTAWHQDIRYWSYDLPELVSVWFALDEENEGNGALRVIPGSHAKDLDRGDFDKDLFFREDRGSNRDLIRQKITLELNAGDLLFFHCRLLHSADRNTSGQVKLSPVFTFHTRSNQPIQGTRSSRFPSISLRDR